MRRFSEDDLDARVLGEVDEVAARVGGVLVQGPRHRGSEVGSQQHLRSCAPASARRKYQLALLLSIACQLAAHQSLARTGQRIMTQQGQMQASNSESTVHTTSYGNNIIMVQV